MVEHPVEAVAAQVELQEILVVFGAVAYMTVEAKIFLHIPHIERLAAH